MGDDPDTPDPGSAPCALAAPCDSPRARLTGAAQPIPSSPPAIVTLPQPIAHAARATAETSRTVSTPVAPPTPPPQAISTTRS